MVDNGYFHDFVASLRTTYAPPSRWKVGESLLDSCYDRVEAEVKGYFDTAPVLIGASDTWNDVMARINSGDSTLFAVFFLHCTRPEFAAGRHF